MKKIFDEFKMEFGVGCQRNQMKYSINTFSVGSINKRNIDVTIFFPRMASRAANFDRKNKCMFSATVYPNVLNWKFQIGSCTLIIRYKYRDSSVYVEYKWHTSE